LLIDYGGNVWFGIVDNLWFVI